jgi:hypothetical protein
LTSDADIEFVVRVVLRVLAAVEHEGPGPYRSTARGASAVEREGPGPYRSTLVTERDVVDAIPAGRLEMAPGAVVTPLAREAAAEKGVELVEVG